LFKEKKDMKRIPMVLVLLVTVLLAASSVSVPAVYAVGSDSIAVPQVDLRSGDQDITLDGAPIDDEGDPDGLDDTNDGPDALARGWGSADAEWVDYLLFLLSQIQLLAL
jgi:hypothetical protein